MESFGFTNLTGHNTSLLIQTLKPLTLNNFFGTLLSTPSTSETNLSCALLKTLVHSPEQTWPSTAHVLAKFVFLENWIATDRCL